MIDPTLFAGLLGAGGSIVGTIAGAILGYKLNNRKADVDVFIDNRVWVYYRKSDFCIYVPITITNEGSKPSTITTFEIELCSPTKQRWKLSWADFAKNNTNKPWGKIQSSNPILMHSNSGIQHHLRFMRKNVTSEGFSDVVLPSGEYEIKLSAFDRSNLKFTEKLYTFNIKTEAGEKINERRKDFDDFGTWQFDLHNC